MLGSVLYGITLVETNLQHEACKLKVHKLSHAYVFKIPCKAMSPPEACKECSLDCSCHITSHIIGLFSECYDAVQSICQRNLQSIEVFSFRYLQRLSEPLALTSMMQPNVCFVMITPWPNNSPQSKVPGIPGHVVSLQ
jgi:hypothetical protein